MFPVQPQQATRVSALITNLSDQIPLVFHAPCKLAGFGQRHRPGIKLSEFQPDLVGISVTSQQLGLTRELADFIFAEFGLPVVLGGVHPTVRPEECIQIESVLGICLGEGEFALLELVEAMAGNSGRPPEDLKIDNFWFRSGEGIVKNPIRPLCEDLDSLPFCDREIPIGTPHIVVWPTDTSDGLSERRHWHTNCWQRFR